MDYTLLNYYDTLFNDYFNYIKSKSNFDVDISKKSIPELIKFPLIVMKEVININQNKGTSTNYQESVDLLTFQVDILTKDLIDDNGVHPSYEVQKELKNLTFQFFFEKGFNRTSYENWENTTIVYDRLTLLFQGNLQSWNCQIR